MSVKNMENYFNYTVFYFPVMGLLNSLDNKALRVGSGVQEGNSKKHCWF